MSTIRINRHQGEEGFTLIELMIVMVVIGILAGIVLFAIGTFQTDAKTATTNTNERICTTAQAAFLAGKANGSTAAFAAYFDAKQGIPAGCAEPAVTGP
jgi:prepilin-type N-terminal cleavage/methylation domain-containing protein